MFVSEENRIKIDAHGMTLEEIKYELDITLDFLPEHIKQIIVVHGYKYGQTILTFLRNEYKHINIEEVVMDKNPGVTIFNLKRNRVLSPGKRKKKKHPKKG